VTSAKTIRAILIAPGTSGCVDDIEDTLPTFQRIGGGYIEQVSSQDLRICFWCNENGKIEGLPVNELATQLWWATNPLMAGRDVLLRGGDRHRAGRPADGLGAAGDGGAMARYTCPFMRWVKSGVTKRSSVCSTDSMTSFP
jgi:hypothetical protein